MRLFLFVLKYSIFLLPFTFLLDCFHLAFGYELIVGTEAACFMQLIGKFCPTIGRHESLFFNVCKIHPPKCAQDLVASITVIDTLL